MGHPRPPLALPDSETRCGVGQGGVALLQGSQPVQSGTAGTWRSLGRVLGVPQHLRVCGEQIPAHLRAGHVGPGKDLSLGLS